MSKALSPVDPSSFSRPDLAIVTDIFINLTIKFESNTFEGNVDLTVKKVNQSVKEVILDAKDLKISAIYETETNLKLDYVLSEPVGEFGSKLTVQLPKKAEGDDYILSIRYESSPEASGLQWLNSQQTAGKKLQFVFSQFQPIHARSVLPCQDTPAVKTKYSAVITAPVDYTVVMSAIHKDTKTMPGAKLFHFVQAVPVQSYLIAIAVGDLESRVLGPRSVVWAERSLVEAAAYEFAETEHQLATAEKICGPYVWERYDLLVLPPSFPFGGMENPCLTFVTPTLLAGDRSLANVVAHEIAHSWTGNLVTNKNFEHFWLNEGFTVFVERKILGRLEGAQMQDFQALGGINELQETINVMGKDNPLTSLVVNLKNGVHPDDAFSRVPYEKGQTFLRYLESLVGGPEVFEPFLRTYFEQFKYQSITTDQFKEFFIDAFKTNSAEALAKINWDLWLNGPGMPPIIPKYDDTLHKACIVAKEKLLNWKEAKDAFPLNEKAVSDLSAAQKIQLLQEIYEAPPQSVAKLRKIQDVFHFDTEKNCEIKFQWLRIGIKAKWEDKLKPALKWLTEVGRMKYVRPLYRELYNWEEKRQEAINNFQAYRKNMMHVSAYTVASDLHLN